MLPIRDINPTRSFPVVTLAIIGANIVVFLFELMLDTVGALELFVRAFSVIPYEITHGVDLPPRIPAPVYLTVFTSMFMHGGFFHIFGNMLYLWIFGNNVEDNMGHGRFLVFYLICGVAAALAQIAMSPNSQIPLLGASGAVAGVLGAYLVMFPRAQVEVLVFGWFIHIVRLPATLVLSFWIVIQLFQGVLSLGLPTLGGVAWFAHIGGFLTGLILVPFFRRREPRWWV
jgi:membrane associated rhomboid family serine protease